MLATLSEAAALISTRDPRTVQRNFTEIRIGFQIRVDTAELAKGDADTEVRMVEEVIGMRRGTTAYSGRNGVRQLAADEAALEYARERAMEARSRA